MAGNKEHWTIVRVPALRVEEHTDLREAQRDAERPVRQAVAKLVDKCERGRRKFVDSSFGATSADADGAKSFYGDGQVPDPRYADPAQCLWVRPQYAAKVSTLREQLGIKDPLMSDDEEEDTEEDDTDEDLHHLDEDEDDDNEELESKDNDVDVFCKEGCLFQDGVNANDVVQGRLGDCWLLSGMGVLASRADLVSKVFWKSTDKNMEAKMRKHGFRVCRFFKDHEWFYVIIDDTLPVFAKSFKPVFAHSKDTNELWVPFLEKAYAKLHKAYDALIGGYVDGALRDMTGLACQELVLREGHIGFHPQNKADLENGTMWDRINKYANQWGCMMGCSIQPDPPKPGSGAAAGASVEQKVDGTGLMMRHAYSLIDVGEVVCKSGQRVKLVRLRNPWGFGEWTGPWSDDSNEFKTERSALEKAFNGPVCQRPGISSTDIPVEDNAKDGTFFMTWQDWKKHFTVFFAAIDFPDEWSGFRVAGAWDKSSSGGNNATKTWVTNPRHRFRVLEDGTSLYFSLCQDDPRRCGGKQQAKLQDPLGFHIVRDTKGAQPFPAHPPNTVPGTDVAQAVYKLHLSVDLEVPNLPKGDYVLVPSTYYRDKPGPYFAHIYANKPIAVENGKLIAEEEEADSASHPSVPFGEPSAGTPSGKQVKKLRTFEEQRDKLSQQIQAAGHSMGTLQQALAGKSNVSWETWEATLKGLGVTPDRKPFKVFSGEDGFLDVDEIHALVASEQREKEIFQAGGDEFLPSAQPVVRATAAHSSSKGSNKVINALVDVVKGLEAENDELRDEMDALREEQARMMNVLLLYGKMLKCYDGEVHRPEALLKKPERKPRRAIDLSSLRAGLEHEIVPARPRPSRAILFDQIGQGDEFLAVKPWKGAIVPPSNPPQATPLAKGLKCEIDWVYGFNTASRNTVRQTAGGKLVYFAAALGVIYDPKAHAQVLFANHHTDDIVCLDFHEQTNRVVTGQLGKLPFACVWDAETGALVCKLDAFKHKRQVSRVQFSQDGAQVLTVGGDDNHHLALYCASSGKVLADAKGNKEKCSFVLHNGSSFATGGEKYMVFLDASLKAKRALFGKKGGGSSNTLLCGVALKDGLVAAGTKTGRILVFNTNRECSFATEAHVHGETSVDALYFDATNHQLIAGSANGAVVTWTLEDDGKLVKGNVKTLPHPIRAVQPSFVALANGDVVPASGGPPVVTGHFRGELWGLTGCGGSKVASVGDDAVLKVWEADTHRQLAEVKLEAASRAITTSADGSRLAVGMADNVVVLYDADSLSQVARSSPKTSVKRKAKKGKGATSKRRPDSVTCLAFSPDGSRLAVGSNDCKVYVLNAESLKTTAVFKGSSGSVTHLDWSRCGGFLRTNDTSYELLFYSLDTGKQVTSATKLKDTAWATTSCPLAWETQGVWPPDCDGTDINACACFEGSLLGTVDDTGKVSVYPYPYPDRTDGDQVQGSGHSSHVTNLAFVSASKVVTAGGNDRTLISWVLRN